MENKFMFYFFHESFSLVCKREEALRYVTLEATLPSFQSVTLRLNDPKDKRYESVDVLMNKVDRSLKIVPKSVEFSAVF